MDDGWVLAVEHDGRDFGHLCDIAGFFLHLADGGLLGGLAGVDQAGGDFDDDLVQRRAVLLLENDFGACFVFPKGLEDIHGYRWMMVQGLVPVSFCRTATIPTPSMSLPLGRV
jgi:hypothetical protein